jgi:xanthine dehydrogenase accessory factor
MRDELTDRAEELTRARTPFVRATVVRAVHPTSAHAGDSALVHSDGTIEGFVGGTCAESSVRVHALQVLVSGEPLLLRVVAGTPRTTVEDGAVTVANPCLSGGSLEIFLEPHHPPARLAVLGDTPVARSLAELGRGLGLAVEPVSPDVGPPGLSGLAGVVVASHGRDEERVLEAALHAGVPYVALVASRIRAAAVLAALDVAPDLRSRVRSPAGLDIGARTAPEIALSVLAELVGSRPRRGAPVAAPAQAVVDEPTTAVDPVCGMTVAVSPATPSAERDGVTSWFCGPGCRAAFVELS